MIDYNELAIADVIKHPILGIVSHQPDLHEKISDLIRVKTITGKIYYTQASLCEWATSEERDGYWEKLKD